MTTTTTTATVREYIDLQNEAHGPWSDADDLLAAALEQCAREQESTEATDEDRTYARCLVAASAAVASSFARLGGKATAGISTPKKRKSSKANGKKGGRPRLPSPTIWDLDACRRIGDAHGNAPRFCPSWQYHSPAHASTYAKFSTAQVRRAYVSAGLSYCRTCQGWH